MSDVVADLLGFIDRSPTPYHAVAEAAQRLAAAGFQQLEEGEVWELGPGDRRYAIRNDGSLMVHQKMETHRLLLANRLDEQFACGVHVGSTREMDQNDRFRLPDG